MMFRKNNKDRGREERGDKALKKPGTFLRRRRCRFCSDKDIKLDYKNYEILATYISEKGKIAPRRISGNRNMPFMP